jgi:tripartite-type tricarboxylate transporter receptor subunit TctC
MAGLTVAIALGMSAHAVPAAAETVADFYKGKQITLIIGFAPGAGYDTYARLLARHYGNNGQAGCRGAEHAGSRQPEGGQSYL